MLSERERVFVRELFVGASQTAAAKRAGYSSSEAGAAVAGSKLVRKPKVIAVMNKAWARSGADIHETLKQAAELQKLAFEEGHSTGNAPEREKAFRRWLGASTLIAHIHGRMNLNVSGHFTFSVVSDEDRAHLRDLASQGVPLAMPELAGGRN